MILYSALIVDIKGSRKYEIVERNSIQKYMFQCIHQLNAAFYEQVEKEVDFSAGDEIQGLFKSPHAAYLYYRLLRMLIFPVQSRVGIGVGEWNIKIEHASTTAQDGPAYHYARHAIEMIKEPTEYSLLLYSKSKHDAIINSMLNAPFVMTASQSIYQNDLMLLAELFYPIESRNFSVKFDIPSFIDLIYIKQRLHLYSQGNSRIGKIHTDNLVEHKNVSVDSIFEEDNSLFITSGKVRGLPKELSDLTGISRQSIDRSFKSANIYAARNAAIASLRLMDIFI